MKHLLNFWDKSIVALNVKDESFAGRVRLIVHFSEQNDIELNVLSVKMYLKL